MEPEYIELSSYPKQTNKPKWNLTESQIHLILLRLGVISDERIADYKITKEAEYMIDKIEQLSISEAIDIIRIALVEHNGDVNFLSEDYHLLQRLISQIPDDQEPKEDIEEINSFMNKSYLHIIDWSLQIRLEAVLIHYHSPYPEIRSITDPFDDVNIPVETFRCYFIGYFWTCIGSIINSFFIHRMPSISLSPHTIQILLLPSGKLWERVIPKNYTIYGVNMNPGPWNYKEMMLASIIYSCSASLPYSIYNIFVMKLDLFYGLKWVSIPFQLLLCISTQFLGFGFALIMKKVCIYPSKAIWPTILPTIALNRALMNQDENNIVHGWKISRYSFFMLVTIFSFGYNWIPSFFMTCLSNFNWPTWFSPKNMHLTNVTGSFTGLGLNPLPSFDWNVIGSSGCLTIPFYTYANRYIGSVIGFLVILIVYYTNNNWTAFLPINSNRLFNNKAEMYDIKQIVNSKNLFDDSKYRQYGPPYFTAANLVVYGANFCLYPFAILYHFVTEWGSMKSAFINVFKSLMDVFRLNNKNPYGRYMDDPHCKMMSKYEDVPDLWFVLILLISTMFAFAVVIFYPVEVPLWGIFFVILINFIFLIPITSIASVSGFSFGLNVLVELIVGYAIPNSGLALITLKAYGYNIDSQASNYITDQKLAHYAKIPPKAIFKGQIVSTLLNIVISLSVANWQLNNIDNLCDLHQKDKLECPGANTYFYSSIQFGEIGVSKVFSGLYPMLKWCFLLGALLVIPCVLFKLHGPKKLTKYFEPTIIMGGLLDFAPYNLTYFTGGLYMSYLFMYYIKRNYLLWWEKFNYILTSGLSAGVAFSALLIFFTVQYNSVHLKWWGNSVHLQGIEGGKASPIWKDISMAPEGYIGLRKDNYP